ncbi:hypothetical protein [Latilactobacillus graminis]|nr:hypothetical protein [Latilactobacillus graminis]
MSRKYEFDPNVVTQFLNQYQDRGMMKCQGFYLSDHTASLQKVNRNDQLKLNRAHSEKMEAEDIEQVINDAVVKKLPVRIERNVQDKDGYLAPFIEGQIEGYYLDKLVIGEAFISIDEIYAIKIMAEKASNH